MAPGPPCNTGYRRVLKEASAAQMLACFPPCARQVGTTNCLCSAMKSREADRPPDRQTSRLARLRLHDHHRAVTSRVDPGEPRTPDQLGSGSAVALCLSWDRPKLVMKPCCMNTISCFLFALLVRNMYSNESERIAFTRTLRTDNLACRLQRLEEPVPKVKQCTRMAQASSIQRYLQ